MRLEGVNCFDSRFIVAPNFNGGQSFSPVIKIEDEDGISPLDNITVSKLGFDATKDTVSTRGIWFENLIYTCSFEFLYFDSFSGSVMRSERVAGEMISFNLKKLAVLKKPCILPNLQNLLSLIIDFLRKKMAIQLIVLLQV